MIITRDFVLLPRKNWARIRVSSKNMWNMKKAEVAAATAKSILFYIELWGASKNPKSFFFLLLLPLYTQTIGKEWKTVLTINTMMSSMDSFYTCKYSQNILYESKRAKSFFLLVSCILCYACCVYKNTNLLWLVYLFSQPWYRHLNKK